jgi:NAD(P)-dependent dehydrogenase (short-subunit alcohol dehydrogenase family)
MSDFRGLTAVVTGGGSGIGRSLSHELARLGATVVVADIESERADSVAKDLEGYGGVALGTRCDVTSIESVEELRALTVETYGGLNILCNNAGVGIAGTLDAIAPSDFAWVFEVNVFGIYYGVRTFAPLLREARQRGEFAHVLNTASEHALGIPPWVPPSTAYSASKHAALGLSDGLRRDFSPDGIGVSVLCPSWVTTDIWDAGRNRPDRLGGPKYAPPEYRDRLAAIGQDPDTTARIALAGVLRNQFLIVTDDKLESFVRARFEETTASVRAIETLSDN